MERSQTAKASKPQFDEYLWDRLPDINNFNRRGIEKLNVVK